MTLPCRPAKVLLLVLFSLLVLLVWRENRAETPKSEKRMTQNRQNPAASLPASPREVSPALTTTSGTEATSESCGNPTQNKILERVRIRSSRSSADGR